MVLISNRWDLRSLVTRDFISGFCSIICCNLSLSVAENIVIKLANGDIPTATLYEDDDFRVILDAGPAAKGHALIIPKEHYANLYELSDELAAKVLVLAKKMITKLTDILGCDGYNIVQNNGEAAGQTVFHFHLHMIPRYKDDGVGVTWKVGELKEEDKEELLAKIKES